MHERRTAYDPGHVAKYLVIVDETEECELVLVPVSAIPELLDEGKVTHALCRVALEAFLRKRRA